jgi:cytochrome c oxidase assembly protein subunit 15
MSAEKTKDRDANEARNAGILRVATRSVAFGVFLLLLAGAFVTSTESGLAVPDWPLSYGKVMPPMVGGILYEHGHRLVAAAVSALVGLEMAMLFFLERRKAVKLLGVAAFAAILTQAVLGGLTVLFLLPPAVSSAHAALAEIVFALTAVVALMCSRTWTDLTAGPSSLPFEENLSSNGAKARSAFRWTLLATAAIYVQIVLGAVMRHTGAGLAIPDFPAAFGASGPPRTSSNAAAWASTSRTGSGPSSFSPSSSPPWARWGGFRR